MKKGVFVGGGIALAVVLVIAAVAAVKMGQKSPLYLSGTVELAESLAEDAKGIDVLYMILYDAGTDWPAPYGAVRFPLSGDPQGQIVDFVITHEKIQIMRPDAPTPRAFRVKARLDKDGIAGRDQPGDIVGNVASVPFGTEGVTITLDSKI